VEIRQSYREGEEKVDGGKLDNRYSCRVRKES
jgi:hypothetical protein